MKIEEKQLVFELCNYLTYDREKLKKNLRRYQTPAVLGHLFLNRMAGIAYGVLKESRLLSEVSREFRNSLESAYCDALIKNASYSEALSFLKEILIPCEGKFVMLKGARLFAEYPAGYRTANDVDLLVRPEDISFVGDILLSQGFRQGYIREGEFIPATRQEIIASKMMRGETVPYIKGFGKPRLRYLEVDLNYSLDFRNAENTSVSSIIAQRSVFRKDGLDLPTPNRIDFLIHLCCHLYKEATTLPWIRMKRDMSLYKFCDIYKILSELSRSETGAMFLRAKELGAEDFCAFAVLWTANLFRVHNPTAVRMAKALCGDKTAFLYGVIAPETHKKFIYRKRSAKTRFFADDREKLLEEVGEWNP